MPTLSASFSVSGQINVTDLDDMKSAGVQMIVCNRPDREDANQPTAAEIASAAQAEGMLFAHWPIDGATAPETHLDGMVALLDQGVKTHAYCRSGMRSTVLWAMGSVKRGMAIEDAVTAAREAGYDLSGIRGRLEGL